MTGAQDLLPGGMDPGSRWPEGLTPHANRVDLRWHERDGTLDPSFPSTILAPGGADLSPSDRAGAEAMAVAWLRPEADARAVEAAFRAVLAALPLTLALPGHDDWQARPTRP